MPLSLGANFSWTLAGNIIYGLCQWGMLIALIKFCPVEQVGQFALGLAITAPVVMLSNLNLRAAQATDSRRKFEFSDYLSLRLVTTLLAELVILGIVLVIGYGRDTVLVVLGVAAMKGFEAVSDVFYGLIQQRERMDRISQSMIMKGLLSVIVLALVTFLSRQVLWGVASLVVIWAGMLFGFDMPNGAMMLRADQPEFAAYVSRLWNHHGHWLVLARLAVLTLPLGLATFLSSLNSNIPNYFLTERDLAIFNAIAYLVIAGNRVVLALAQSAMPRLARSYANRDRRDYLRLFMRLMLITIAVGAVTLLVTIVGGKPLLTILYRPEYAERIDLFVLVMIAATVGYIALGLEYTITATRHFGVQMPLLVASGLTMLLGCGILIPQYGLIGAGLAMILAAAVEMLGAFAVNLIILHRFQTLPERGVAR